MKTETIQSRDAYCAGDCGWTRLRCEQPRGSLTDEPCPGCGGAMTHDLELFSCCGTPVDNFHDPMLCDEAGNGRQKTLSPMERASIWFGESSDA